MNIHEDIKYKIKEYANDVDYEDLLFMLIEDITKNKNKAETDLMTEIEELVEEEQNEI